MSSQGDGMQVDGLGSDRKHPRTWEDVRAREGFDDLRPIKRHQFSSSIPNVMSSPALSSLRQPTVTLATTDPPRIDQSSGVLMSAQSASHLSGCNMTI
ncbi:hypothetical protein WOLCODRAFT_25509 [Wolfiporia cocos MD-104 SS10]|uniref:Uncharacterized protein n=1 Tax=Wolfiporia cocos (strain MD-104) TaxID=742152 RepID=A0A2H3JS07_WOLCO|nr:hypothetical protein WOLCODRAFT_25509 [Wolfiporia cocos MD-104 SS10]